MEDRVNAILWLERHAPGFSALSAEERDLLMHFSLLWSLFEGEVLHAAASVKSIETAVQKWNQAGALTQETFATEIAYFKERYFANGEFTDRFRHLHLERSRKSEIVQRVLSDQEASPASIAVAVLIIVFRYRNNLFHGEKWAYELREQKDNFVHANAILMRAIDLNRRVSRNGFLMTR